jgi:hypothetical protein
MAQRWIANQDQLEGKMTISDEVFGEIDIRFYTSEKKLHVEIKVSADEAKEALIQTVNDFRLNMQKDGFTDVSVDIQSEGGDGLMPDSQDRNEHSNYPGSKMRNRDGTDATIHPRYYDISRLRNENATLQIIA